MRLHLGCLFIALYVSAVAHAAGSTIVRVEDPSGSHCIDALTEDVTIHVRRIFTQKESSLFTEDRKAGVITAAKLTGRSSGSSVDVQVPSISLVTVEDEKPGRVSLPLEYQIASYLALRQGDLVTTDIALSLSLAKARGRNSFGELLDLASKALNKLPIPNNPYTDPANKFLAFANDAINETTRKQLDVPFAQMALSFNRGSEPDLNRCRNAGKERTGAIAVLLSRGAQDEQLIPVSDTDRLYCFKYSSQSTYELLAGRKVNDACPFESAYRAVPNDYVMLLISANPRTGAGVVESPNVQEKIVESRRRCRAFKLEPKACGVGL